MKLSCEAQLLNLNFLKVCRLAACSASRVVPDPGKNGASRLEIGLLIAGTGQPALPGAGSLPGNMQECEISFDQRAN
jgi:hypothetical protein